MIDLDDLLAALIVEDQNKIPETLEMLGETGKFIGLTTHQPFLPAAATSLLESIQQSLPQSQSIPTSADMAISPALGETLAAAIDLREKLQSKEVNAPAPLSRIVGRIAPESSGPSGRRNHRRTSP